MSTIFTLKKLYRAYRECQRGKKNTVNALTFEYNREKNLLQLLADLESRKYQISRHIYFIVTKPTPREIFAADFRDRIVHHLLCSEIQNIFENNFIENSYANRKGKGTHKAVIQLRANIQSTKRLYLGGVYYLKLDIENFFRSIDQTLLFEMIEDTINKSGFIGKEAKANGWKEEILWLTEKIIFHDPTQNYIYRGDTKKKQLIPAHKSLFSGHKGKGLPIGNLTSQFFANVYLNSLDQFVTKNLGLKKYVRYVDDFVLVDADKQKLHSYKKPINHFLQNKLKLRLHPKKQQLHESKKGIDFLGYFVKPNYTLVRQKVVKRLKDRLHRYGERQITGQVLVTQSQEENDLKFKKLQQAVSSYGGHFSHAQSFRLQKRVRELMCKLS